MIVLGEDWRDGEAWDRFVERHEQARFCHLFKYAGVVACYGYAPRNICFLKDRAIVGVLPAVDVKSLLFGRKLVSQPFSEFGGLLLDPTLGDGDIAEIFELLREYLQRHPAIRSIEIHGNHGVPDAWRDRLAIEAIPHHIGYLELNRSVDELWTKVIRPSVRNKVTQARKHGLEASSRCNEDIIRQWYFPMYLRSMKRLGVPPHKIDYYLNCYDAFGDNMIIFWATKGSTAIAALLGFSCSTRVNIINTVSDPEHWHLRPNDLVHWEFIKWAAETNHKYFDFGSIRYQGQMEFKKKWGCQMAEHKHYFFVPREATKSARTVDSSSKLMTGMAALWSHYMPIALARVFGPMIRKHLAR